MMRMITRTVPILLLGWLLPSLLGCASASARPAASPSLAAFTAMQLRERAGLYPEADDWSVPGDAYAPALHRLEAWANARGIFVLPAPISRRRLLGHASRSAYLGWVVLLDDSLSPNNQLYTLLHELGHVYGPDAPEEGREVIAELVAASVCARLGLDVWPQTAAYLAANVAPDVQVATAQRFSRDIDQIVERLTKAAQETSK